VKIHRASSLSMLMSYRFFPGRPGTDAPGFPEVKVYISVFADCCMTDIYISLWYVS